MANRVTQIVEWIVVLTGVLLFGSALQTAFAQDSANLPYMNPQLLPEQRATFYAGVDQLPNFEDYGMANRTYRYFTGKPLYAFGYGLSHTKFTYSDLSVPAQAVAAGQPVGADVTVTNTGNLQGMKVVQLYLQFPAVKGAPLIALRGSERIHLELGASQKIHFNLKARDLGMVTENGSPTISQGDYTITIPH